jgi:hypothetical protein
VYSDFQKKMLNLACYLLEMDTNPDRQALVAYPYPDPTLVSSKGAGDDFSFNE